MADDLANDSHDPHGPRFTDEGIPFARPLEPAPATITTIGRHPMFLDGMPKRSIWWDLIVTLIILIAIEFTSQVGLLVATGLSDVPGGISDPEVTRVLLVAALPARAVWVTVVILALLRSRRQSLASIGLTGTRFGIDILIGIGTVLVAYSVILPLGLLSQLLDPGIREELAENAEAIMSMVPRHSPSFFLWFALVIGFYEELLFRGFLMTRLRRVLGNWYWAVVASTAVFVLPHLLEQTIVAVVPLTILSILFSVVTIWRRSVLPAVIGHWLFNLSQFISLYYTVGDSWV